MDAGYNFAAPAADLDSVSAYAARTRQTGTTGTFDLDDFYYLFATQLQNQDMMNPVDDGQFLAQMAQMALIQAMDQMNATTMTSYAFGFMGREVIVADFDASGQLVNKRGTVEKVVLYNGTPQVYVDGQAYDLAQIMEVFAAGTAAGQESESEPEPEPEPEPAAP
jgi:flagellar hook assembly protein FlgD